MVGWLDGWMVGWLDGWLDGWMVGWLDGKEIFEYTSDRSGPKTGATRGQDSLRSELLAHPSPIINNIEFEIFRRSIYHCALI